MVLNLAQETLPTTRPFFERLMGNDTIRNTTAGGWFVLLGGIFAGVVIGKIAQTTLKTLADRITQRGWAIRGIVVRSFAGPINLALIGVGVSIGIGQLAPSAELSNAASKGLGLLYIIAVGWLIFNLIDVMGHALESITAKTENKLDDQLVPLITKTIRVFLLVIIALFTAENVFGANISAWLAGLGIAGLAVSLAAQDSIKNIFGSITILFDQPFAKGDFVKVEGIDGSVEEVGFRSTRIRTPDGVLVTIPNSKVADAAISNMQQRPSIRRVIDLGITWDTPPAKIQQAIDIVKQILAEPDIAAPISDAKLPPRVFFDSLNTDSLNIKVFYWFTSLDYWAYMAHAEKVNLQIIRRFADASIDFAFPTRTLYLAGDAKRRLGIHVEAHQASGLSN